MMVSREEILWAYRFILGRDPEGESAYLAHEGHGDWASMRRSFMESPEARMSVGRLITRQHAVFDYFRPLLVFIHIEKTGGTSLLDALTRHEDMVVAPHGLSHLPSLTLGYLNQYDCIGGHFTYQEAVALPRHPKKVLTILRDPAARLISFYRFHRAHQEDGGRNSVVGLAHALSAPDFFRHPDIAGSHRMFNNYVHSLAGLPASVPRCTPDAMHGALERSFEVISMLDAVGITERMAESEQLFRTCVEAPIAPIATLNHTDQLGAEGLFRTVEPVEMTDELKEAIAPLIAYDRIIYDYANDLLSLRMRRLAAAAAVAEVTAEPEIVDPSEDIEAREEAPADLRDVAA